MANLLTYANSVFKPYYKYMIIAFLVFIFIVVARFTYQSYFFKTNKNKKYSDVANANNNAPVITVYFFHVDWCPHCIKAQPEWNNFVKTYDNKMVNGYLVKCYDIDCTDDNGDSVIQFDPTPGASNTATNIDPTPIKIIELVKKYNITSYPTVKLTKDDVVIEFDAKVTADNLAKFINSV